MTPHLAGQTKQHKQSEMISSYLTKLLKDKFGLAQLHICLEELGVTDPEGPQTLVDHARHPAILFMGVPRILLRNTRWVRHPRKLPLIGRR